MLMKSLWGNYWPEGFKIDFFLKQIMIFLIACIFQHKTLLCMLNFVLSP
ncbi:hypothetical protein PRO82_001834 [Candidatus Protochlamydia amoebophila]|nr:hypothetical protein [Candidatus Protochlamydia amoebophila]